MMKKTIAIFSVAVLLLGVGFFGYTQLNSNNPSEEMTITSSMEYPHYESIDALSNAASDIVMGKIVDVRVEELDILIRTDDKDETLNPGGEADNSLAIYTVYTLEIIDVYKGKTVSGERIKIKQLGGDNGESIHLSESTLNLGNEHEYVFFLQSYDNVPASILNPYQGAYFFDENVSGTLSDKLLSVSTENDLTLTYGDLQSIVDKN